MDKIEILINIPNEGEEYKQYILDSISESCELAGCSIKSISISGDTTMTKEFMSQEDIIEAEFEEIKD